MNVRRNVHSNLERDQVIRIITLIEEGYSQRHVAHALGVNQSSVSRALARYREIGSCERRPVPGRPRCTTRGDERFVTLQALRRRHLTARQLQSDLSRARNTVVSTQTVRRILRRDGIRARVALTAPHLTRAHRVARLRFAREHVNWGIGDWASVLFTDESRFCFFSSDRRVPVYRRDGERYSQCNIRPSRNFGGGSVMLWGGISLRGRTELVPVNRGTMTADRYIRDILQQHVIPYAPFVGPEFILMHDNARPHVARIVRDYLDEVGIPVLDWPAFSPDMNPIEHVWDYINRRVRAHNNGPATLHALQNELLEEWENLDQDYIRRLIESMPNRMRAVITARGANTGY